MREFRNRRPREDIMKELVERSDSLDVLLEQDLVESVKELYPEVRLCTMRTSLGGNAKGLLFHAGKFYDIEDYVKLLDKLDNEALERGEYKRWTKEGVEGAHRIRRKIIRTIVDDLKAGRLKEWADAWVMYENGPLIT